MSTNENRRLSASFDALDIDMRLLRLAREAAFKALQKEPNAPQGFTEMTKADWDFVFAAFLLLLAKAESEEKWKSPIAFIVDLNRRKCAELSKQIEGTF